MTLPGNRLFVTLGSSSKGPVGSGDEARAERLPDKCTIRLQAGDVVRMLTPGGGGWGAVPDAQ